MYCRGRAIPSRLYCLLFFSFSFSNSCVLDRCQFNGSARWGGAYVVSSWSVPRMGNGPKSSRPHLHLGLSRPALRTGDDELLSSAIWCGSSLCSRLSRPVQV
ncbi:hypothetical protein B0H16DRAFT_519028 [Mycena metata]|uniref:Secreted protein n=1 Tax=Mycena metata TaxID=1033252 RepID=A0AAD7JDY4_9AGAR|nr:hypothetical protein B0H16DRAFT_519028 [Mycena metata]